MAKLRVGIIGAGGGIANRRAQYFTENPNSEVVLCASRSREKAAALAEQLGCDSVETWQGLAQSPEVDAVCIATPNALHYEQAKVVLEAGKHAEVEYPLCQTLERAAELKKLADSKGVVLHHGLNVRSEPLYLTTLDNVNKLGSIACARITYFGGGKWYVKPKVVGNMFLALHLHFVDYFRGWFGEVKSVVATRHESGEGDTYMHSGTVMLQHERCPAALIEFGMGYVDKPKYTMQILGSDGLLAKDDKVTLARGGEVEEIHQGKNVALKVDTDNFVARVVEGATPLRTWEDGLRTMQVSLDCTRSVETGKKIVY